MPYSKLYGAALDRRNRAARHGFRQQLRSATAAVRQAESQCAATAAERADLAAANARLTARLKAVTEKADARVQDVRTHFFGRVDALEAKYEAFARDAAASMQRSDDAKAALLAENASLKRALSQQQSESRRRAAAGKTALAQQAGEAKKKMDVSRGEAILQKRRSAELETQCGQLTVESKKATARVAELEKRLATLSATRATWSHEAAGRLQRSHDRSRKWEVKCNLIQAELEKCAGKLKAGAAAMALWKKRCGELERANAASGSKLKASEVAWAEERERAAAERRRMTSEAGERAQQAKQQQAAYQENIDAAAVSATALNTKLEDVRGVLAVVTERNVSLAAELARQPAAECPATVAKLTEQRNTESAKAKAYRGEANRYYHDWQRAATVAKCAVAFAECCSPHPAARQDYPGYGTMWEAGSSGLGGYMQMFVPATEGSEVLFGEPARAAGWAAGRVSAI